ncbi:MAG: recombinase family protein [Bacilli bacterium]
MYLRLSDEDKHKNHIDDDSESIKNQRNLLLEEIKKHPEYILVDEYSDEDLSGAGTYRPEFERLIKDCKNKKLDIVLCKSQSRFSRDMEIIEKYLHNKFLEWNVRFISLSDNADTANIGNKKSRQINGLVNEWYLEDVSNNIRSAFKAKMKNGEFISPFAPFGYEISKINNNKLIVDKEASEIVKKIFQLYIEGFGFGGIAKYLNEKNIPSPSLYKFQKGIKLNIVSNRSRKDIKWSNNAIKNILKNEVYLGHLIQGKRTTISYKNHKIKRKDKSEWIKYENTHPSIIDKYTFNKVQNIMKQKIRTAKNSYIIHNLSGKVFCLECKSKMRKKNSSKHNYLVCSNYSINKKCTNVKSIRYDELEKIILKEINKQIEKFYDENALKIKFNHNKELNVKHNINNMYKQYNNINNKIIEINNYIKNLYEDKVNDIITNEQFCLFSSQYNNDLKKYKSQINLIKNNIELYKNNNYLNFNHFFNKVGFKELNRIIVEEFIKKIYIGHIDLDTTQRDIIIEWNF